MMVDLVVGVSLEPQTQNQTYAALIFMLKRFIVKQNEKP